jgi:hypothetical protein
MEQIADPDAATIIGPGEEVVGEGKVSGNHLVLEKDVIRALKPNTSTLYTFHLVHPKGKKVHLSQIKPLNK